MSDSYERALELWHAVHDHHLIAMGAYGEHSAEAYTGKMRESHRRICELLHRLAYDVPRGHVVEGYATNAPVFDPLFGGSHAPKFIPRDTLKMWRGE